MEPWSYTPADDLDQGVLDRLKRFPRQPDMLVYGIRSALALLVRGWLRSYHRLSISGAEHLPASGSFVVVANHASHLDALCILAALPLRKLHRAFPAAAADYFFVKVPRVAAAVLVVNAFPFQRQTRIRQSLAICKELLANPGNILILFPEGTRSPDGTLQAFKPGIGTLLAGNGVPAIPCALHGAAGAWPKGAWMPRPRRVRLTIGAPRLYDALPPGQDSARRIAQDLESAVRDLIGAG